MSAMRSTATQEPYRICIFVNGALSNHAWIRGTRLGLCESTRSITTFRGQGRITVSRESTPIARNARKIFPQWARRRGSRRSEEHTSELQSPCNLVCRLLLEKKKKK